VLTVKQTSRFKKDSKKFANQPKLLKTLVVVIDLLAQEKLLPRKNCDHALTGNYVGFRDCHIAPDVILIYQVTEKRNLLLHRLGSHSELFK